MEVREGRKIRPVGPLLLETDEVAGGQGWAFRSASPPAIHPRACPVTRESCELLYLRPGLALCLLQAFLVDRPYDILP
jgi:hypothetical protein